MDVWIFRGGRNDQATLSFHRQVSCHYKWVVPTRDAMYPMLWKSTASITSHETRRTQLHTPSVTWRVFHGGVGPGEHH
jgi:hypothetical protein